jgi:hypothetical protein
MKNNMNNKERKLRAFEAVAIAVSGERAKNMPTTPEIEAASERLYAAGRRMMAQVRYKEFAAREVKYASAEIRPEVMSMCGAEVRAELAKLRANYPALQHAHREGDDLSDHDLRTMLEDALKLTKDME